MQRNSISVRIRFSVTAVAVALLLALSACSAPPTTTYTNAAGQEVTVSWKDFPAYAMTDPDELLSAPAKEDAEVVSAQLLENIKSALTQEYGVVWAASGEAGWFPEGGNGYGGKAMTSTYNSVSWLSNTAPADTASWERIVAIVNRVTAAQGLGSVKLSPSAEELQKDAAWRDELVKKYGTADPRKLHWWMGNAYGASQWLSMNIVNVDRDGTGEAAKEYAQSKLPPRSISLSYGVTTLAKADIPAFKKAMAPFAGLTPPEPTTSD